MPCAHSPIPHTLTDGIELVLVGASTSPNSVESHLELAVQTETPDIWRPRSSLLETHPLRCGKGLGQGADRHRVAGKSWDNRNLHPPGDELNKLWYIPTKEHYAADKKDGAQ